jgi:hypothetical protein
MAFYFAWVDAGTAFDAAVHNVEDEKIFGFSIAHNEGDFPTLAVDVANPKLGLLASGRKQWCWLSWDGSSGIEALFTGRLVGIPTDLHAEVVTLQFVARPSDYDSQKATAAAALKVAPFWDPVWVAENEDDPDTALEAYPLAWHIDRLTLAVTVSDLIDGEDGTIAIGEADHLYDDMQVGLGQTPLNQVAVSATVTWTQRGAGEVDLTRQLYQAFAAAGPSPPYPAIASMTGDGLFGDWPKPGANIGAGWSMAADSSIVEATWLETISKAYLYTDDSANLSSDGTVINSAAGTTAAAMPGVGTTQISTYSVVFDLGVYIPSLIVAWDAARNRSETVTFTLSADVQPILSDPGDDAVASLSLQSNYVDQPIDDDAALPIGDLKRNAYFPTDRGQLSFQYLVCMARAQLLARARAVSIQFTMPFALGAGLSCRKNITLTDGRLPGGVATGKVIAYTLAASGDDGSLTAQATIGCTVGNASSVSAAAGTPTYIDGYIDGYQAVTGAAIAPSGVGDVTYQGFDDIAVVDDDGIDLLNMVPATVLNSLTVANGTTAQLAALGAGDWTVETPSDVLSATPTQVTLDLVPIGSGPFATAFAPTLSTLAVPKTIDLSAAAG